MRPAGLTNKEPTEKWTALEMQDPGKLKGSIPRRDLVAFMLQEVEDDATIGKALGVAANRRPGQTCQSGWSKCGFLLKPPVSIERERRQQ